MQLDDVQSTSASYILIALAVFALTGCETIPRQAVRARVYTPVDRTAYELAPPTASMRRYPYDGARHTDEHDLRRLIESALLEAGFTLSADGNETAVSIREERYTRDISEIASTLVSLTVTPKDTEQPIAVALYQSDGAESVRSFYVLQNALDRVFEELYHKLERAIEESDRTIGEGGATP